MYRAHALAVMYQRTTELQQLQAQAKAARAETGWRALWRRVGGRRGRGRRGVPPLQGAEEAAGTEMGTGRWVDQDETDVDLEREATARDSRSARDFRV